jgi:hypothetical protein
VIKNYLFRILIDLFDQDLFVCLKNSLIFMYLKEKNSMGFRNKDYSYFIIIDWIFEESNTNNFLKTQKSALINKLYNVQIK